MLSAGSLPSATPHAAVRRAEPPAAWAHPHAEIGSYGTHANALPHGLRPHVRALEGLTGIVPTATPHAAARRAEPPAAWAHPAGSLPAERTIALPHGLRPHVRAMEGATGIEPAQPVWKTGTLPLSYAPAAAGAAASDSL